MPIWHMAKFYLRSRTRKTSRLWLRLSPDDLIILQCCKQIAEAKHHRKFTGTDTILFALRSCTEFYFKNAEHLRKSDKKNGIIP